MTAVTQSAAPELTDATTEKLISGDLSTLDPKQRIEYYCRMHELVGASPALRLFGFVKFEDGKVELYANKNYAAFARDRRALSVKALNKYREGDYYFVETTLSDSDGRTDTEIGGVWLKKYKTEWDNSARKMKRVYSNGSPVEIKLHGPEYVNAIMKAVTKSKRRATLSITGLGLLDETELETIEGAKRIEIDHKTGDIVDEPTPEPPKPTNGNGTPRTIADVAMSDGTAPQQPRKMPANERFEADDNPGAYKLKSPHRRFGGMTLDEIFKAEPEWLRRVTTSEEALAKYHPQDRANIEAFAAVIAERQEAETACAEAFGDDDLPSGGGWGPEEQARSREEAEKLLAQMKEARHA